MDATPRRRRNWLLIVSLCLNVMLIAAIVTVAVRIAQRDTRIGAGGPLAPRSLIEEFPNEKAAIETVINAHTARIASLRQASRRARVDALNVLAAPDAAPQKLGAAFAAIARADAALEAEAVAMSSESTAMLSPAERQALADRLKRRSQSWWFRMMWRRGRL